MKVALWLGISAVGAGIAGIVVLVSAPWSQLSPWLLFFVYPALLTCATAAYVSAWHPRFRVIHWIVAGLVAVTFASLALNFATGNMRLDPPEFEHPLREFGAQVGAWTSLALPVAAALTAITLSRLARFSGDRTIVITVASAVLVWPVAAFTYPFTLLIWPIVILLLAGAGVAHARRGVPFAEVSTGSTTVL